MTLFRLICRLYAAMFLVMSIVLTTINAPKNPAERRGWIVWQLRLRGTSLRRLAADHGVSQQAMSHALTASSSHLEAVIAEALGLMPEQLFPERFDAQGKRLTWTRDQQRSTRTGARNVEEEQAA